MKPDQLFVGQRALALSEGWSSVASGSVVWVGFRGRWFVFRCSDGIETVFQWSESGGWERRVGTIPGGRANKPRTLLEPAIVEAA